MPTADLLNLLSQNNLSDFFHAWPNVVHPTSPLNASLRSLRADWNAALEDFIQGNRADDGSKAIREKAFALVDRIVAADLEERKAEAGGATEPKAGATGADQQLNTLMEEKLAFLRRELVLAVDPSAKFMLTKQIQELERELGG